MVIKVKFLAFRSSGESRGQAVCDGLDQSLVLVNDLRNTEPSDYRTFALSNLWTIEQPPSSALLS